ncbi:uncharacterized protein LOC130190966 [Pseudoliparis swirei]|uniref:uncharacterized protein LOC130190966 n=1 Tax=Pseudoliparis swirei TaxID=2059687 RepID=UPI0024BDF0E0|nr:uncharacterized protein LOC130190966 [Pseudoliparis swirei]
MQEGEDLILEVHDEVPEDFYAVYWRFNNMVYLVRFSPGKEPEVSSNFTGRVEFPGNRFSVKLKNLQLADSGVYTAGVITVDGDQRLDEYEVTVLAPVSPVKLSVVSRSSASCNLTVSCSTTRDSHIISSTFTCADGACGQEGGGRSEVTTPGASLRLYLLNGSIVCHHSNQVHWTQASEGIRHVCSQYAAGPPVYLVKIVVFSVGLVIMVSAVIAVHLKEKLRKHR